MNIAWWDAGNTDNVYCGSDGGSNIRIPLIRRLNNMGHTVFFDGPDPGNYEYDESTLHELDIAEECYRFRKSLECVVTERMAFWNNAHEFDAFVVEARSEEFSSEFEEQLKVMRAATSADVPVLLFDRNNWARELPSSYRVNPNVTLLRPYPEVNDAFPSENQVFFPYWIHDSPFCNVDYSYDLVYVGNRYGREEQMDEFLDGLTEELDILVAGNWTEREQEVTEKYSGVDFVGPIPHFAAIPFIGLGKATFHVGKPDYNDLGLLTMRPYESYMAQRPCFVSDAVDMLDEPGYFPAHLHTSDSDTIIEILNDNRLYWTALDAFQKSTFAQHVNDAAVQIQDNA